MAEQLVINGVSLNESHQAWTCKALLPLWTPSGYRSGNVVLPGASGARAIPYRVDEGRYSIQMFINGWVDYTGVSYTDFPSGLATNISYLTTNLLTPPTAPTATYAATLTLPAGTTRTANVQVLGFEVEDAVQPVLRAVLDISVPAGRFV